MVFVRTDGQGLGRVAAALAGGAVAVMPLSGCQGDTEPTPTAAPSAPQASASATPTGDMPTASPTAAATPRPSPASSAGPATNLPVPVKPALADENTAKASRPSRSTGSNCSPTGTRRTTGRPSRRSLILDVAPAPTLWRQYRRFISRVVGLLEHNLK